MTNKKTEGSNTTINYVDAICGSGKSFQLKQHILGNQSEAVPERHLFVMPTHLLCEQFQDDLKKLKIKSFYVEEQDKATLQLFNALDDGFKNNVIICTHECFKHYAMKAKDKKQWRDVLKNVHAYCDEIPEAMYGAYIKLDDDDSRYENFPFLSWIEDKNGLQYISDEHTEEFESYYHEKEASGSDLKQLLFAMRCGAGLLYEEKCLFAYGATPILHAAAWCESFTLLGAGAGRSHFLYVAENIAGYDAKRASSSLHPLPERRKHKQVPVTIIAATGKKATLTQLSGVFNRLPELVRMFGNDNFIYATNKDKRVCNFTTIADDYFTEHGKGERISMASYGLNDYQHFDNAIFLGCCNFDSTLAGKWSTYVELNGWSEDFMTKYHAAMNYERAYQFVSRCSIRNAESKASQMYLVPDLGCAEYLKEHYFRNAAIKCLEWDTARKPRDTSKGDGTHLKVQECKSQGMKQREAAEYLNLSLATIKRNWNGGQKRGQVHF